MALHGSCLHTPQPLWCSSWQECRTVRLVLRLSQLLHPVHGARHEKSSQPLASAFCQSGALTFLWVLGQGEGLGSWQTQLFGCVHSVPVMPLHCSSSSCKWLLGMLREG